ncbi:uncharacterized protein FIBRA_04173 [Fibroporia radiculosa]|uniref:Uncharacterized protein n=1 Tax=Fibroporia radiculosa TaxID=599839 RepID=J4IA10_9APHY|nr:uncharacterized protein FIBRA_04173 [Fibroporia radiculosa]CCM02096.1 predicted protein [Fibroporia radiculosa]
MAALVRHYKNKYARQRELLDRLKNEYRIQKANLQNLQSENNQLRQDLGYGQTTPSEIPDRNGKRRMLDGHRHSNGTLTSSSPRTVVTPIGPNRLTLPPDHQQPTFASNHASHRHGDDYAPMRTIREKVDIENGPPQRDRPGSSRFAQEYAYIPPPSTQSHVVPQLALSHAQAAPARHALARQALVQGGSSLRAQMTMPPPPHPTDRISQTQNFNSQTTISAAGDYNNLQHRGQGATSRSEMPPPPTPRAQANGVHQRSSFQPTGMPRPVASTPSSSRRFVPPRAGTSTSGNGHLQQEDLLPGRPPLPTQSADPSRFLGPESGRAFSVQHHTSSAGSRAPSSARHGTASLAVSGGQRMSFVPGS